MSRNSNMVLIGLLLVAAVSVLVIGCGRGRTSDKEPIHLNPNMDMQPKYKAQSTSQFFADSATMRVPVTGTIQRGDLREDVVLYTGKDDRGNFEQTSPMPITTQLLTRGRERYDIYCTPCHSRVGDGKGIMVTRGYVPPPSFHTDRIRQMPDGQLFDVITNGVRNMPSYNHQIPVEDRWAIVAYLRALQRSQNATVEDIPTELRETVK